MLKTGPDYPYSKFTESDSLDEYRLAPNDLLSFSISTNNGQELINPMSNNLNSSQNVQMSYLIELDGTVNIPLLNRPKVSGMTLREAEYFLEEKFKTYFKEPFVTVSVTNNRVIIFSGNQGGNATVLFLENSNTTLFEALAKAGGITDGKAYRVKLIRGKLKDRKVYLIDLSKIDGLKDADIILKANDIIYVDPLKRIPQALINQATPYLALLSTLTLIYSIFR
jgi:polysaccharide export outer membrane protein